MKILNPLKMNNWETKKFLMAIFVVQIVTFGLIILDNIGLGLHILRELFALIYLFFVPGILILRVLRLKNLSNIETLLFSVGLSIAILMFIGLFINILYPLIGFSEPLSLLNLIVTLTLFLFILSLLTYFLDNGFSDINTHFYVDLKEFVSPNVLFLYLIPLLSVLGSLFFYYYDKNMIFLVMMIFISITIFLIGFKKIIPPKYYPVAIFMISLALLYHTWLITPYLVGSDVHSEFYASQNVLINSYWSINIHENPILFSSSNAMILLTLFAPIVSKISSIDLVNIYKIVFPFLIALIPLGLFEIFKNQTDDQISFLSTFLFIIMGYYNVFLIGFKQSMAVFFIVLILMCIFTKSKNRLSFLSVIFAFSLVFSHYGTSYLFGFIIVFVIILIAINRLISSKKSMRYKFTNLPIKTKFNTTFVLFFITLSIGWYIYVSNSAAFINLVSIGNHIISSVFLDMLSPQSTQGLGMVLTDPQTFSGSLQKSLIIIIQIFIILGLIRVLFKDKMNFDRDFIAVAIPALLLDLFAVIIPNFSSAIYTPRLYEITLIFLAPLYFVGGILLFDKVKIIFKSWNSVKSVNLLSVILIVVFLLQTGFVKEIVHDPGTSISLSKEQMMNSDIKHKSNFYSSYAIFDQNYYSLNWLYNSKTNKTAIFTDDTSRMSILSFEPELMVNQQEFNYNIPLKKNSYLYLSYSNIKGKVWFSIINLNLDIKEIHDVNIINQSISNLNQIYSNGGSEIYTN